MAEERYLSRRTPDLCVGNNIDKIDKKPILQVYIRGQRQWEVTEKGDIC